jgi:DNA ligase (NAD+)
MPQVCPACGSKAVREEDEAARRCVNASCPAQVKERLAHFASRDAMDIEGVGPALINQLVDKGLVKEASDLYSLTADQLMTLEGIAEKSSENILASIRNSVDREFQRVLFALGMRHVGWTTANALADAFGSMAKLQMASEDELSGVLGIGKVVATSVRDFLDNPQNKKLIEKLAKAGLRMEAVAHAEGPLEGKVFLFTGELKSMGRAEAGSLVESLGGTVGSSLTKSTNYVVVGEDPGSKVDKAKKMGKTLLTEQQFLTMVGKG